MRANYCAGGGGEGGGGGGGGGGASGIAASIDFSAMSNQSLSDGPHTISGETFTTNDGTGGSVAIVTGGVELDSPSGDKTEVRIDLDDYGVDTSRPFDVVISFARDGTIPNNAQIACGLWDDAAATNEHGFQAVMKVNGSGTAEVQLLVVESAGNTTDQETFNGGTFPADARLGLTVLGQYAQGRADASSSTPSVSDLPPVVGDIVCTEEGIDMTVSAAPDRHYLRIIHSAVAAASASTVVLSHVLVLQNGAGS